MTNVEKNTGTENEVYDLISIMYHALQGAQTYHKYTKDASGDQALLQFFQQVHEEDKRRADMAMQLLKQRLSQ